MFYEAVAADNRRSIGMAVSKDGVRDWQRLGRPVLEAGQPGSWDAGGVCSPSVVSMAGKYHCQSFPTLPYHDVCLSSDLRTTLHPRLYGVAKWEWTAGVSAVLSWFISLPESLLAKGVMVCIMTLGFQALEQGLVFKPSPCLQAHSLLSWRSSDRWGEGAGNFAS